MWRLKGNEQYEAFSYLVMKLALISFPFVMLAGYIDAGGIPDRVRGHFLSAIFLAALTATRFFLRRTHKIGLWQGNMKGFAALLLVFSVILTALTAHLGGVIAYGSL